MSVHDTPVLILFRCQVDNSILLCPVTYGTCLFSSVCDSKLQNTGPIQPHTTIHITLNTDRKVLEFIAGWWSAWPGEPLMTPLSTSTLIEALGAATHLEIVPLVHVLIDEIVKRTQ